MRNKGLVAVIIILFGVIIALGAMLVLVAKPEGFSFGFFDRFIPTATIVETTTEEIIETSEEIIEKTPLTSTIKKYTGYNGNVNIEYPEIVGLDDSDLEARINNKIKMNATSIVSLYPVSTALQTLDISCEVKILNDDIITIIYTGRLLGKTVKSSSTNSSNNSNSSTNDNYVNYNQYIMPTTAAAQQSTINSNALPLPSSNTTNNSSTNTYGKSNVIGPQNVSPSVNNSGTADLAPTVREITSPTAESRYITSGNTSTNTPTYGNGSTNSSNAPILDGSQVSFSAPIFGYASTNTSASTIDNKIFYTNTINLKTCLDVHLSEFADPTTLAKYARSSKVEFVNIDSSNKTEVRNYIKKTVQSTLAEQLSEADFRNVTLKNWPKNFSYRDEDGTIYFTCRLSSKLGNYAIIKYVPED